MGGGEESRAGGERKRERKFRVKVEYSIELSASKSRFKMSCCEIS